MDQRKANTDQYGFYGRLNAAFPSQLIIDTTEICNLACTHCPHPQFKKSEHYSGTCLDPDLNAKAVDEVREHGKTITQYIRYTGQGEPLLHKKIYEMIGYAVQNSGTTVTLTTNGSLMDESKIERLLASGLGVVDISIDAYKPETYAKVRVNGDLNVTRSNVLKLLAMSKRNGAKTKIVVSYIEQPANCGETADFERFWKESGADFVVVRRLHSGAGAVAQTATTLWNENRRAERRPCLYPWERIVLNPLGNLVYCPQDWVHGATISDYRRNTILETWKSDYYQKLREAHLANSFKDHAFCGQCPDWSATRWPNEGRSYANMIEEFKVSE